MGNNTRWFDSSEYNTARVIERIADMIIERGGRVKFRDEGMEIRTRGFVGKIESTEKNIDGANFCLKSDVGDPEKIEAALAQYEQELAELKAAEEAAPTIKSRFMTKHSLCARCIHFVLDQKLYYFEFDDNPFFPDMYHKIPLNADGEYAGRYYSEKVEHKPYYIDALWKPCATEEEIDAAAELLLDFLTSRPSGERYYEKEKRRVPNTYNDGYHDEMVVKPESNARHKVDF